MDNISLIESIIVTGLRPHFLSITKEDNIIHIIVCHPSFQTKMIPLRIRIIFDLIRESNPNILKEESIIVEAYDSEQMNELFEHLI